MATKTWNGGSATTDNFSDGDNWGGTAPVAGDDLVFAGTVRLSPNNDTALSYRSISFAVGAGDFVIGGNAITLSGGSAAVSNLATSGTMTIGVNLTASTAAPTINCAVGGSLVISGTFNGSTFQVSYTGGGVITMSGNISGSGLQYINIGSGRDMAFTGAANNFTGAVTINAGRLRITNSASLGTGTKNISINGSGGNPCLRLDGSGGAITLASTLTLLTSCIDTTYGAIYNQAGDNVINGNFSLTTGNGNTIIFAQAGTLTLNGNISAAYTTRTLDLRGSGTGYFTGALSSTNTPSIAKSGTGSWYLTGNTTLTSSSTTTITGGTLYANGRALGYSAVTVTSPGVLRVAGASGTGGKTAISRFYNVATSPSPFVLFNVYADFNAYWVGKSFNLVETTPSLDFGQTGTGFPAPYNSSASNFQVWIKATLVVPTTGTYTFDTNSDDGSCLFINTTRIVDNNGSHGMQVRSGTIALTAGTVYELNIVYYQGSGGYGLRCRMSGADNTTMAYLSGDSTAYQLRTLDLQIHSLAGNGSVVIDTGTLIVGGNANASSTFTGVISGVGNLETVGTGTMTLTGTHTLTGAVTINNGILTLGNGTTDGSIADVSIINAYNALIYNVTGSLTQATPLAGTATLTKLGTGTLNIPGNPLVLPPLRYTGSLGANALSGNITVSAGTLQAGGYALGSGNVTVESGAFLETTPTPGVGAIHTDSNSGQTNLATDNLFFTWMTVSALRKRGTVVTTLNMGTSGAAFPSPYNQASWGNNSNSALFACRVVVGASGTYTWRPGSDDGSMLWVNGALVVNNNFAQAFAYRTGTLAMTAGTRYDLVIGFNNSSGQYGFIGTVSGADNTTYADISTANANLTLYPDLFIGGLAGAGEVKLTNGNLWIGGNGANTTFDGVISGTAGLRCWGADEQTLTGVNTYTGTTELWLGALIVNGSTHASSPVLVNVSGTLAGNGTINGTLTTYDAGRVAPGAVLTRQGVVGLGTLSVGSNTNMAVGGYYFVDLAPGPTNDVLAVTGTLTLGGYLRVASQGASTTGQVHTIATATVSITGLFNGLNDGDTFVTPTRLFTINYYTNSVVLTDAGPNTNRPDTMMPLALQPC